MTKAYAVIGANYGDEGKGLITDYLTNKHSIPIVVRHNGGAQAGHTVWYSPHANHVFHHFGAGTFAEAMTFLSQDFIVNPIKFNTEYLALEALIRIPTVFVDMRAIVTTPYDMIINQVVENHRTQRHGSCGLGINETVVRNLNPDFAFTLGDLVSHAGIFRATKTRAILERIRQEYMPARLLELTASQELVDETMKSAVVVEDVMLDRAIDDFQLFIERVSIVDASVLKTFSSIIFEGAQGLLLDQDNKDEFPHVTRSSTGLTNIIAICREVGITDLEVSYVTRSYLTRHGAGVLANEDKHTEGIDKYERTNITNKFQGHFRYALLNLDQLMKRIDADFNMIPLSITASKNVVMTCLDQVKHLSYFSVSDNGALWYNSAPKMPTLLEYGFTHYSQGPTRNDVFEISREESK